MMNDENQISPFTVFSKNCASKFSSLVKRLTPSNIDISIDIILSKTLETIFYNPEFLKTFEEKRIKISFLETLDIKTYDMDVVSEIIVISSCETAEVTKFIKFLNEFTAYHRLAYNLHMLIYPRRNYITKKIIETQCSADLKKMLKSVNDINFDFFALDDDLLNLEYSLAHVDMFKTKELHVYNLSAEALYKFQLLVGAFTEIAGKGEFSNIVLKILGQIEKENTNNNITANHTYPSLFIIDRAEDVVTPFLSQFTYTGLLDQVFGVSKNIIRIPKKLIDPNASNEDKTFYNLMNEPAKIYAQLKNLSYPSATWFIRNKIVELSEMQNEPIDYQNINASIKKFEDAKQGQLVKVHFKFMQASDEYLKNTINIICRSLEREIIEGETRDLFDKIIELIQAFFPVEKIFQLLALANVCSGGFTAKQFEQIYKEVFESYGSQAYNDLMEFEMAGFFTNKDDPESNFSLIKKTDFDLKKKIFFLINPNPHQEPPTPSDYSGNYDGINPVLIKTIESILIPGRDKVSIEYWKGTKNDFLESEGIMVFVVGGITYSEIACIRRLSKFHNKKILICATNIITSESIVRAFITPSS